MISVAFDELGSVASRIADAGTALTDAAPVIPTDAATLASSALAGAAASFARAMTRRHRAADTAWEALRAGVTGTADDFRAYEHTAVQAFRSMEAML